MFRYGIKVNMLKSISKEIDTLYVTKISLWMGNYGVTFRCAHKGERDVRQ